MSRFGGLTSVFRREDAMFAGLIAPEIRICRLVAQNLHETREVAWKACEGLDSCRDERL